MTGCCVLSAWDTQYISFVGYAKVPINPIIAVMEVVFLSICQQQTLVSTWRAADEQQQAYNYK